MNQVKLFGRLLPRFLCAALSFKLLQELQFSVHFVPSMRRAEHYKSSSVRLKASCHTDLLEITFFYESFGHDYEMSDERRVISPLACSHALILET